MAAKLTLFLRDVLIFTQNTTFPNLLNTEYPVPLLGHVTRLRREELTGFLTRQF